MPIGTIVRYYNKGWRIGRVVEWGRKWVRVRHPLGTIHRLPITSVQPWSTV